MIMNDEIVISNSLDDVARMHSEGYLTHALCSGGGCEIALGGRRFAYAAGDCLIVPQQRLDWHVEKVTADFRVTAIYVLWEFIQLATPASNYGTHGHFALYEDPVMHLTEAMQRECAADFDYVQHCLAHTTHHFHRELLVNAVQRMILDFFEFHTTLYGDRTVSAQQSQLMQQFIALLEGGEYLKSREVGHYADRLCVTAKHLSDVCRAVSGQTAIYWITRYTAHDIAHRLRTTDLTIDQLTDLYGFASTSYFIRYVQNNLGLAPSALRE